MNYIYISQNSSREDEFVDIEGDMGHYQNLHGYITSPPETYYHRRGELSATASATASVNPAFVGGNDSANASMLSPTSSHMLQGGEVGNYSHLHYSQRMDDDGDSLSYGGDGRTRQDSQRISDGDNDFEYER